MADTKLTIYAGPGVYLPLSEHRARHPGAVCMCTLCAGFRVGIGIEPPVVT